MNFYDIVYMLIGWLPLGAQIAVIGLLGLLVIMLVVRFIVWIIEIIPGF